MGKQINQLKNTTSVMPSMSTQLHTWSDFLWFWLGMFFQQLILVSDQQKQKIQKKLYNFVSLPQNSTKDRRAKFNPMPKSQVAQRIKDPKYLTNEPT